MARDRVLSSTLTPSDLRNDNTRLLNFSRSINLALSERGINAMRSSGSDTLLTSVLAETIPMYGRMIHSQNSRGRLVEASQLYDVHGRFLRAIDRTRINGVMLDELERMPNVTLLFNYNLTGADFIKKKAWFELRDPTSEDESSRPREIEVDFDLLLGCDGAHSRTRYHMNKFVRMNYEQTYIETLWCEFSIPPASPSSHSAVPESPSASDGFKTSPHHLHIWPSSDSMFISLPNKDGSFTCTLFAPPAVFDGLARAPQRVESFFEQKFPGVLTLVGVDELRAQFERNPHLPLVSVKCDPHHFDASVVVLGDAAHAMVPFYGQGMNAGLEDVLVLFEHLDSQPTTPIGRAEALKSYTSERVKDAHTINDLAVENYWEMHAGVRSPLYLLRKYVEEFLSDKVPRTGFQTQYARVSFSNQRYSEVVRSVRRQGRILLAATLGIVVPGAAWTCWALWRWHLRHSNGLSRAVGSITSGLEMLSGRRRG